MNLNGLEINRVIVGELETNCYVLRKDNNVLIIDPGADIDKIKCVVDSSKVLGILLTHHHFDHIGALDECISEYKVKVYDYSNLKEESIKIDNFVFNAIFTPGHTKDSVTYYFEDNNCFFTGDFIFQMSIGRMDLGGNQDDMIKSIQNFFKEDISEDKYIFPGHGLKTTVLTEKEYNPYIIKYLKIDN